jgi:hypothetical protein
LTAAVYRPTDAEYWVANWSGVLFAGDLFAAIPFIDQPSETLVDETGQGKHFLGPIAFGYGLLISPTCDMVDQKTLEIAHPYRIFVPVVPLSMVAEAAPGARGNIGLIRSRDSVLPYMYLPPLPGVLDESAACLFRPALISDEDLRAAPRRIVQLAPEGRRQLKIKLIRYWGRFDPEREDVNAKEQDEERFAVADGARRPYDIDPATFPEDVPVWRGSVSAD